jgi:glycerol-3-phosphate acyltransferase PlsX
MKRIAIDMMGSDKGPEELSQGVLRFLREHSDVTFLLFGNQEKLVPLFKDAGDSRVIIKDTNDIIPMEVKPLDFLRKKNSSLYQAILAVKEGEADAVVSAGSTPGLVTGATALLKNIDGVRRAGFCTPMPTLDIARPAVVMDVGANNVNTAEELVGFAKMAKIFARDIIHYEQPSVYLLTNGTEEGKGRDEIVSAYHMLKDSGFPGFQGNAEARNVLDGKHDVIVTSGFDGNIFLKSTEGTALMVSSYLKKAFKKNLLTKIGYLFERKGIADMKEAIDYKKFGGAILLGINGVVVKAHGSSNAYAFYHALRVAKEMVDANIVDSIHKEIA